MLPQLMTGSLHALTSALRRHGWAGYGTRYWLTGDQDPCVAYLARAAWEDAVVPEGVYRDQVAAVCGSASVEAMLEVFRQVEQTTVGLEWEGLGLTFPVPGMILRHWRAEPLPAAMDAARDGYRRGLDAARRASERATPDGRWYAAYWVGRLEFGVAYLDAAEAARQAATSEEAGDRAAAARHAARALAAAVGGLEAYARVAVDRSDLGAIATMNEYVYRPLRAKVDELRGG